MRVLRRILPRKGIWISTMVAAVGVSTGVYVAMVTPPLSGGTLAGLGLVAAFGLIAVRVIHVANRKQGATSW